MYKITNTKNNLFKIINSSDYTKEEMEKIISFYNRHPFFKISKKGKL